MPKLVVSLANCPMLGEKFETGGDGWRRRSLIELRLSGVPCELRQTQAGMSFRRQDLNGKTVHTTTLHFQKVRPTDRLKFERIAGDLAWLLSLATMSPVVPFKYEFGAQSRNESTSKKLSYYRPLIDSSDGALMRSFLEATWPNYRRLKRSRRLPTVIDYLVHAHYPDQPMEVEALLAFVVLESLKSTWIGPAGSFKQRVDAMTKAMGMRVGIKRLIKLRNRIVHEGIAGIPYPTLSNHTDRLHDFVREYLLRLLGYAGPFAHYSSRSPAPRVLRKRRI